MPKCCSKVFLKISNIRVPFGLVGWEAMSSLWQPRIQVLAWVPLLLVTPPLSHPVSYLSPAVLSIKPIKGPKKKKKIQYRLQMLKCSLRLGSQYCDMYTVNMYMLTVTMLTS